MSNSPIVRDVLGNGIRLLTERMTQVRSISIGVWLTRGSRHEAAERGGIAHFVEHMLFKGTTTRSAEDIAQAIDSIGGQLDAFTAKEYASYYIKVLDEHLPLAIDILSDIVMNPAFSAEDIEREKKVVVEEIKMVEDTPDDLVHELFTQGFWADHPLGRPILGTRETVESFTANLLRDYFHSAYTAPNLIISAVGNLEHDHVRELVEQRFASVPTTGETVREQAPTVAPKILIRNKELEQSHLCLGASSYPQNHDDRYSSYVLNTLLGGGMSSRLFQNIRERQGLAYAVFSELNPYRDTGCLSIYAGTSIESARRVVESILKEFKLLKNEPITGEELRRAKDHLKGSLMLSLESTSSRMSNLARQEMYFHRFFTLDELVESIENVTAEDVQRISQTFFDQKHIALTVLGNLNGFKIGREDLVC